MTPAKRETSSLSTIIIRRKMRIFTYTNYIYEILLILSFVQAVYAGCFKFRKFRKGDKGDKGGKGKEQVSCQSNETVASQKPDNWPKNAATEIFPASVNMKRLRKGSKPIEPKQIQQALRAHREQFHAYHVTHRDFAATFATGTEYSNTQMAKDALQMAHTSD
ncbi:uncharacterized protein FA14DRAFT_29128 [Meira miltonrushii]|uniref:Uncharacterized protein n=1 Tax=Meira miltonrushii TaxID=1280837 RepID=A0A316V2Q4_9BASI|nr:uncharacterized protein FA14DRAFT_29128 [Meira miltonrushii]PWN31278.1 hypothetical protein FA14DRAFT_29128 [Meira miltonrushii]